MSWEDLGSIKASKVRQKILILLFNHSYSPKELSERMGKSIAQISRNLSLLEGRGIIRCMTPPSIRKGKIYVITEKGKEIVNKLALEE